MQSKTFSDYLTFFSFIALKIYSITSVNDSCVVCLFFFFLIYTKNCIFYIYLLFIIIYCTKIPVFPLYLYTLCILSWFRMIFPSVSYYFFLSFLLCEYTCIHYILFIYTIYTLVSFFSCFTMIEDDFVP